MILTPITQALPKASNKWLDERHYVVSQDNAMVWLSSCGRWYFTHQGHEIATDSVTHWRELQGSDNVHVTENLYRPELLAKHRSAIFVFGDNLLRKGKKGQAVIRDEPNAFGIATKVKPSTTDDSYFNDADERHKEAIIMDIERLVKLRSSGKYIVFPKAGIGTGLSKMPEKCPELFRFLCMELKSRFGFVNGG